MKLLFALALVLPAVASAHMVSMSTGELKVHGSSANYELRMPIYEAAHTANPERILFDHIQFRSRGVDGKLTNKQCTNQDSNFVCTATYEFPAPVEELEVDCTFAAVTVPNHIHLLRAYREDKTDQAVFDVSFTTAEIRFRPPATWEVFVRASGAGFFRAIVGIAPLLFLLSLSLAARTRRELMILAGSFLTAEALACALAPYFTLSLSPRFIEAAAALTIAYLAFEILLLPNSGQRWLVVGILGLFHGMYFSLFLTSTGYGVFSFLAGVLLGEVLVVAALFLALSKALKVIRWPKAIPAAACILMTVGIVWFVTRVWSA